MDTLLQIGLSNALVATLVAVLVAGLCKMCRRPALVHTLWLLVLLKLITPSPLTLPVNWPAGADTPDDAAGAWLNAEGLPAAVYVGAVWDRIQPVATWLERWWGPLLLAVWLSGSALWFALASARSYRFARLLRHGRPAPERLRNQTRHLAARLGLGHCPDVWLMPGMLSPMLWGLGSKARLLLPSELLARLTPDQLQTLLVHELAHARRRDPWVRLLELVVLGLYWWHPVAWWARRQLREAEEQCCDAWVVWTLPTEAPSYATALVETVAFLSAARPALPPAASGISYVHVLQRRLTLILCATPPRNMTVSGFLAVLGLGVVLLPWRPVWGRPEPADAPPTLPEPIAEVRAEVQLAEAQPVLPAAFEPVLASPALALEPMAAPEPPPPERRPGGGLGRERPPDGKDRPTPMRGPPRFGGREERDPRGGPPWGRPGGDGPPPPGRRPGGRGGR